MHCNLGRRIGAVAVTVLTLIVGAAPAVHAAGTRAGSVVSNVAEVTFSIGGVDGSVRTAAATFAVGEILQVVSTTVTPVVTVPAGPSRAVVAFRIANTGNGDEAVRVALDPTAPGGDFVPTPAAPTFYLDTDGSGSLTPADVPYVPGTNDPLLAPDATALLFAVFEVAAGIPDAARSRIGVTARAVTGSGAVGAQFPGAGDGGVDAVAGLGGAQSAAQADLIVSGYGLAVAKSALVADAGGGTRPEPGARIDYELAVSVTGTGTARAVVVRDPIPAATRYVPGSLTLDGVAVADAVGFQPTAPARIELPLGDLPAGTTRRVRFAVLID
jgi:uncharacterized repeat protein (TIGR01451 family)